jgi:hypothetical protein
MRIDTETLRGSGSGRVAPSACADNSDVGTIEEEISSKIQHVVADRFQGDQRSCERWPCEEPTTWSDWGEALSFDENRELLCEGSPSVVTPRRELGSAGSLRLKAQCRRLAEIDERSVSHIGFRTFGEVASPYSPPVLLFPRVSGSSPRLAIASSR